MKDGNYQSLSFSNSGRYMSCIRKDTFKNSSFSTFVEIYDMYQSENYQNPVTLRFETLNPACLSFSPLEQYLVVSEYCVDKKTNVVRIIEIESETIEVWRFKFEDAD